MWKYTFVDIDPYELYHWGIMGQKWGIRRYQNPDGTLTEAGKKRYWGGGSGYTHVGRQRYIKDLVKDYNEINGTSIKAKKAVVRVDGKYYNGKGVELDPRNLQIMSVQGQNRSEMEAESKNIEITSASKKKDIDKKKSSEMTKDELRAAKEYYELLNAYERAGAEYAQRHPKKWQGVKKFVAESGKSIGKEAVGALGKALAKKLAAQIIGVKTMDISKLDDKQIEEVKKYIGYLISDKKEED